MREDEAVFEDEKLELLMQYIKETTGRLKYLEKKLTIQGKRIADLEKREAQDTNPLSDMIHKVSPSESAFEEIMRARKEEELMRIASAPVIPREPLERTSVMGGMYAGS